MTSRSNECKRRKIKCNGESPCHRCGNLSLECLYAPNCCSSGFKDSEYVPDTSLHRTQPLTLYREFRQINAHISSLQEQVDNLYSNLNALHGSQDYSLPTIDPNLYPRHESSSLSMAQTPLPNPTSPSRARGKQHRFQGPTSSAFNFDVAKSSLQTMGITRPEDGADEGIATRDGTPLDTTSSAALAAHPSKDPLWLLNKDEAVRLCRVYDEEMGLMYPMLDIERLVRHTIMLFAFMETAARTGLVQRNVAGPDNLDDDDTRLLKMVLAAALIVEGSGQSELGRRLFETVRQYAESSLWGPVNTNQLRLLVLVVCFR